MKIKNKIISYFLISVIIAGLIVFSCFSTYAESFAQVYLKWNTPSQNGYTQNVNVTFKYINGNYNLTYNCVLFEHYYYYTSGSFGSTWYYYDKYYVETNTNSNWIGFYFEKGGLRNCYIKNGNNIITAQCVTGTGTYNISVTGLTSTRPIKENNSKDVVLFDNTAIGYTLTFDSRGGSAITAESGVTDVILGDSSGYFPQYIPTRLGYTFLGWSLTPGGTYVREVTLTEDTTIYANWNTEYIPINWTEIGTEVGYMSFTSSWLLDDPDSNTHEIVNFDTCYYNLFDNELFFCNGTFDVDSYDGKILNFATDSTEAYITYYPDYQDEGLVDIDLHSTLPVTTTNVMGLCDFEYLYSVTGWKLADFTQPDGTTTINYITQSIDLYTNVSLTSPAPEYSYNNRTITYYYSGTKSHWYNEFNVTYYRAAGSPGFTETIKATQIENTNKYMFSVNTQQFNEISISLKVYPELQATINISGYDDYIEGIENNQVITFDNYNGLTVSWEQLYPYVVTDVTVSSGLDTFEYDIYQELTQVNGSWDEVNSTYTIYNCYPYESITNIVVYIMPQTLMGDTPVERVPVVVFDESGNVSYTFSLETLWEDMMSGMDYSYVYDTMPKQFNGIMDGFFSLAGLSVVVVIILFIGFSAWFLRKY